MTNKISLHKCMECGYEVNSYVCAKCSDGGEMVQYKSECPACYRAEGITIEVWGDNLIRVKSKPHMGRCKRCQYRNHLRFRMGQTKGTV